MRTIRWIVLALWLPSVALGGAPPRLGAVDAAGALLSRYPAGQMPIDEDVMGAIGELRAHGERGDVPVLRSLVERERPEIAAAATTAISAIRDRQRDAQRVDFASGLPDWPDLTSSAPPFRARGLGREEAACAAYAEFILGGPADEVIPVALRGGAAQPDAEVLLAGGAPRRALAAIDQPSVAAGMLAAQAREDLGDVRGALRTWATLAASGVPEARNALDSYGIDAERLLLGILVERGVTGTDEAGPPPLKTDAQVLEVLVRHGGNLTVAVLAEQTRHGTASDGATAADALGRMLDPSMRAEPLPVGVEREARHALYVATAVASSPVAEIATEVLANER